LKTLALALLHPLCEAATTSAPFLAEYNAAATGAAVPAYVAHAIK